MCLNYNVKFWIGDEEINLNNSGDRLNIGFKSLISEDERFRIRERVIRGKRFKLKEGKYFIGKFVFGYGVENGKILVNEKGKYVKWIYKIFLYKNVNSYSEVELRLNNKFKGCNVSVDRIRKVLQSNVYCGYKKVEFVGEFYDFYYESLVSDDDNRLVKNKIKDLNSKRKRKSSEGDFLLKGKVFCNSCGKLMWIVGSGGKKYYKYYSCSLEVNKINSRNNFRNKEIKGKCNSIKRNKINLVKFEKIVWDCLFDVLLNSKKVLNEYGKKYSDDRVNEKNKKVERKEIFLDVVKKLSDDDLLVDVLDLEKEKYLKDINDFDIRINELNDNINKLNLLDDKDVLLDKIKDDLLIIYEDSSFKNRKRFLDKYVESVYVNRNNDDNKLMYYDIIVKFKFDIGNNKKKKINLSNRKFGLNNIEVIDKDVYKLKNVDLKECILVYKDTIKIKLFVNLLLYKNTKKSYDIGYLKSKIYY
jgi:hypothetical protein